MQAKQTIKVLKVIGAILLVALAVFARFAKSKRAWDRGVTYEDTQR